jgi:hypothetical protein
MQESPISPAYMADVKKFPRARRWGLCSRIEQIWEEHVLDGEATLR